MGLLCDALRDLRDLICGNVVELTDGVTAKVTETVWTTLDPRSQSAIDKIDQIHSLNPPFYDPPNAGDENATVDTSSMTTGEMGDDACERARAAYEKACVDTPTNHEDSSTALYETRVVLVDLRAKADPT